MKRKRFSVEQIVAVLKQDEVGVPVAELIRQVGITELTLYRRKICTRYCTRFLLFLHEPSSTWQSLENV